MEEYVVLQKKDNQQVKDHQIKLKEDNNDPTQKSVDKMIKQLEQNFEGLQIQSQMDEMVISAGNQGPKVIPSQIICYLKGLIGFIGHECLLQMICLPDPASIQQMQQVVILFDQMKGCYLFQKISQFVNTQYYQQYLINILRGLIQKPSGNQIEQRIQEEIQQTIQDFRRFRACQLIGANYLLCQPESKQFSTCLILILQDLFAPQVNTAVIQQEQQYFTNLQTTFNQNQALKIQTNSSQNSNELGKNQLQSTISRDSFSKFFLGDLSKMLSGQISKLQSKFPCSMCQECKNVVSGQVKMIKLECKHEFCCNCISGYIQSKFEHTKKTHHISIWRCPSCYIGLGLAELAQLSQVAQKNLVEWMLHMRKKENIKTKRCQVCSNKGQIYLLHQGEYICRECLNQVISSQMNCKFDIQMYIQNQNYQYRPQFDQHFTCPFAEQGCTGQGVQSPLTIFNKNPISKQQNNQMFQNGMQLAALMNQMQITLGSAQPINYFQMNVIQQQPIPSPQVQQNNQQQINFQRIPLQLPNASQSLDNQSKTQRACIQEEETKSQNQSEGHSLHNSNLQMQKSSEVPGSQSERSQISLEKLQSEKKKSKQLQQQLNEQKLQQEALLLKLKMKQTAFKNMVHDFQQIIEQSKENERSKNEEMQTNILRIQEMLDQKGQEIGHRERVLAEERKRKDREHQQRNLALEQRQARFEEELNLFRAQEIQLQQEQQQHQQEVAAFGQRPMLEMRQRYPAQWQNMDQLLNQNNFWLKIQIPQNGEEFQRIQNHFRQTMAQANIIMIERIQNKLVWNVFQSELENMRFLHGGEPLVRNLFHGTRGTDPSLIYAGQEGFDKNYSNCNDGGLYFHNQASYSNKGFVHTNALRQKQLFYAKVILGVSSQGVNGRMPKMNPATGRLCDSVDNGGGMFMVYQNKKAYPEYLITYTG